jgi:hypothetical protein
VVVPGFALPLFRGSGSFFHFLGLFGGDLLPLHFDLVTDMILQILATDELVLFAAAVDVRQLELVRRFSLRETSGVGFRRRLLARR